MTKRHIMIIVTLFALTAGCSSELPRPAGAGWFKCPHCQGTGKLAFVGKPGGQGMLGGKTENEILPEEGPLNSLVFGGLAALDGDKNKVNQYDHDGIEKQSDSIKNDLAKRNLTSDSGSKVRYKQCGTCSGIGWVK